METRELDSNIQRLENVVEVKREQLSVLERDVDEEVSHYIDEIAMKPDTIFRIMLLARAEHLHVVGVN